MSHYWVRYRSSITGRFVSKAYADEHPDTTVRHERYSSVTENIGVSVAAESDE